MSSINRLRGILGRLGLGTYEVRTYLALVEGGPMTAREAAEAAGVPYSRIYSVLKRLESLGAVSKTGGRPERFFAMPPIQVYGKLVDSVERVVGELRELMEGLQAVYESRYLERRHLSESTFLNIIRGREQILSFAVDVLEGASEKVYVALPYMELLDYRLIDAIMSVSRHADVYLMVTEPIREALGDVPPRIGVKVRSEMFGGGFITSVVLLVVKHAGELLGVYTNDRYLVDIAKTYYAHLWGHPKSAGLGNGEAGHT